MPEAAKSARPDLMHKHPTLSVNAFSSAADYQRTNYHVKVPNDVPLEDILRPIFLGANHSRTLKVGDLVDIVSEDLELDIQLRVIRVGDMLVTTRPRIIASTREIDESALEDEEPEEYPEVPEGYQVRPVNGKYFVRITSIDPPTTLKTGIPTKGEAIQYAISHARDAAQTNT